MSRSKDPLAGLADSLEAEQEAIERRFLDADRFTQRLAAGDPAPAPPHDGSAPDAGSPPPQPRRAAGVVRTQFSFPQADYALIDLLQERSLGQGVMVTRSELARAGLRALDAMTPAGFRTALAGVERLKPGRKPRS